MAKARKGGSKSKKYKSKTEASQNSGARQKPKIKGRKSNKGGD